MDCTKVGSLIAKLRKEKQLTQKELADQIGVLSKTVSKWETGKGCPDIEYWSDISNILEVDMASMMEGEIIANKQDSGNISKVLFYVCPVCNNILVSTSSASIVCCGRKLDYLPLSKETIEISVEEMDLDHYITFNHPMFKDNYIAFIALVKDDRILLNRLYPEQSSEIRIPINLKGTLYLYSTTKGLMQFNDEL